MPVDNKPRFSFIPKMRAHKAEEARVARGGRDYDGRVSTGELWDCEVTDAPAGDYHRKGDRLILELAR